MQKIILVTCVKEKQDTPALAKDMYQGELFQSLMQYAKTQNPDKIFILSGKYGLLALDDKIEPYDLNLHHVSDAHLKDWSENVLQKLAKYSNLEADNFIYLCSHIYAKYLIPATPHFSVPLEIH